MLPETEHARLLELQGRPNLSESEQSELELLLQKIEESERAYLEPATTRLRAERLSAEERLERLESHLRQRLALAKPISNAH